jgi:hypothetical protein
MKPLIQLRSYQRSVFRSPLRTLAMMQSRQSGKSYGLACQTFDWKLARAGVRVFYVSGSLAMGEELLMKEAEVWQNVLRAYRQSDIRLTGAALDDKGQVLDLDALADLLVTQKLETFIWHTNTLYSRSKVLAPNPRTVRGYTGHVVLDEIGFMPNFGELWAALEPILSSNREFKLRMASTPPVDEAHQSFQLLSSPPGTIFTPNADGHFYTSQSGIPCFRADIYDCELAGAQPISLDGREVGAAEHRQLALNKDDWDREYNLKFSLGGSTRAFTLAALRSSAERGAREACLAINDTESRTRRTAAEGRILPPQWALLLKGAGEVSLGLDLASTEGKKSNPAALVLTQRSGSTFIQRVVVRFKVGDPTWIEALLSEVIGDLAAVGIVPRGIGADATNEALFADTLAAQYPHIPFHCIKGSQNLTHQGTTVSSKKLLGDLYVEAIESGSYAIAPVRWLESDHMLIRRSKGSYESDLDPNGGHGDTFDGGKLAHWVLITESSLQNFQGVPIASSKKTSLFGAAWDAFRGKPKK